MASESVDTAVFSAPAWTCDPVFGIVHPSGCTTCLHYMKHLAKASDSGSDSSVRDAVRERDSQSSIQYLNGFLAGNRVQLQESRIAADLVEQYRDERDEALELASRSTAELLSSKEELHYFQEQLRSLQVLVDEIVEFATSEKSISGDRMTHLENILFRSSSGRQEETCTPQLRSPQVHASRLPTPPTSPACVQECLYSPPGAPEASPVVAPLDSAYAILDTVPPQSSPLSTADEIRQDTLPVFRDQNTAELAQSFSGEKFGTASALDAPGSTLELDRLMNDAHDDDAQGQLIPSVDRTDLQRFSLLKWTDVHPSPILSTSTSPDGPICDSDATEIFVDASGWGIGFVLNGRWLAWKLKPEWRCEGRDNNWAEMVAVELGLRVAIAAGFHSQTIVLRSDNWGVVRSLLKGKSRHVKQREILKEIIPLTRRHNVTLIPVWIPTAENPADNPSRGDFAAKALLFPSYIPLPAHLAPFLNPSV